MDFFFLGGGEGLKIVFMSTLTQLNKSYFLCSLQFTVIILSLFLGCFAFSQPKWTFLVVGLRFKKWFHIY